MFKVIDGGGELSRDEVRERLIRKIEENPALALGIIVVGVVVLLVAAGVYLRMQGASPDGSDDQTSSGWQ